jgi:hypothetical protein
MNQFNKVASDIHSDKDKWIEKYARIGYVAKGITYCLVGGLAVTAALTREGNGSGRKEAFQEVLYQPFGKIILGILAFGLLGYAIWRMIQAIKDTEHKGTETKGLIKRIGYGISSLTYAAFTVYVVMLITGSSSGGGDGGGDSRQFFVNKLLEQPFGQWLVGIVAVIIIIRGLMQIYSGYSGKFNNDIKDAQVDDKVRNTYNLGGKAGYISRGIVFCIIGYFFIQAALKANPNEAQGTDGVFSFLNASGGPWLMGLIALGLLLYGLFMFVRARFGIINYSG